MAVRDAKDSKPTSMSQVSADLRKKFLDGKNSQSLAVDSVTGKGTADIRDFEQTVRR